MALIKVFSLKILAERYTDFRSAEALSIYPSDCIVDILPVNSDLNFPSPPIIPDPNCTLAFKVLNEPPEKPNSP